MNCDIACAVSSLEPSELTALLLLSHSQCITNRQVKLILIEDGFVAREYAHEHNYYPNNSFPAYQIHRIESEKYSPVYYNLGEQRAFQKVIQNIKRKPNCGSLELTQNISKKIEKLSSVAGMSDTQCLQQILGYIFEYFGVRDCIIQNYSSFLDSKRGRAHSIKSLYEIIDTIPRFRWAKFSRAGSVILFSPSNQFECRAFTYDGKIALFQGSSGEKVEVDFKAKKIRFNDGWHPLQHVRFKGVALNIHLGKIGLLPHAPWYCSLSMGSENSIEVKCLEVLSPIANIDNRRVSRVSGGDGVRLNPSAYTLLEYEHPQILKFIQFVLQTNVEGYHEFHDWLFLSNHFPKASQKPSKNSRQVRRYVNKIIQNERTEYHSSLYLKKIPEGAHGFGLKMRMCVDQLNRLRKSIVIGVDDKHINHFLFEESRPVIVDGVINIEDVRHYVESLLLSSRNWRHSLCLGKSEDPIIDNFKNYNYFFVIENNFETFPSGLDQNHPNIRMTLNRYARFLIDEIYEYYSLVFVLLHSFLKATSVNLFLSLEKGELQSIVDSLVEMRGGDFYSEQSLSELVEIE